jgi:non-ribosomal peptide synthase protein (TIGR01720 family)
LTKERFIANPFQTDEEKICARNGTLYRTGDLVRWTVDGNLEYIGRNDLQVKIRGHRVELSEIEAALSSYNGIKHCVVLVKEHPTCNNGLTNSKYLVGYYVSNNILDEEDILNYLKKKLPDYMVPIGLVQIKDLPLTLNGKLDKQALPEPNFINENKYVASRNELESQICQIWTEVLRIKTDKIGIQDNFFRLGGDSIVSILLVSKLRQKLKLDINVKDIFDCKTVEKLSDLIISKKYNSDAIKTSFITEQGILDGKLPLLPIQQWFFLHQFPNINYWNQSFIVKVPNLDINRLQTAIVKLIEYHDSFRLRYKKIQSAQNKSRHEQYYDAVAKVGALKILNVRELKAKEGKENFEVKLEEHLTYWQSEFDIEKGPVYSIGYLHGYDDGSSRIYFAFHHLIIDSVSWRILIEDLKDLYDGKKLAPKGTSYRQWINKIEEYASVHQREKNYWLKLLSDCDNRSLGRLVVDGNTKNYANICLSKDQTKYLLTNSNKTYNTQINDLLLTALGYTLPGLTGKQVNHILLEGHGREEISDSIDITRTIGWFTTLYPVRLEINSEYSDSIKKIKEILRQIPHKGIGYGSIIGYELEKHALPGVSFNYLGQFDNKDNSTKLEQVKQTDSWYIVNENSGIPNDIANPNYNFISINGWVIDGCLQFSIVSKFDNIVTNNLAASFQRNLEEIINHTMRQSRSFLTLSDLKKRGKG